MIYVEAPNRVFPTSKKSIFLAGTIQGSADWQAEIVKALSNFDVVVFNPRRKDFPIHDPSAAQEQITWEFDMLKRADMISFWFAPETLGPIVLLEYGRWTGTQKPIVTGMDPKYPRRQDVEIQTKLIRPEIPITYSMEDFTDAISAMINQIMLV
jgi:hypothetical protein